MCFSAIASFTAAALLLPTGIYANTIAWDKDIRYIPLAIIPMVFGFQQGVEGLEWLSIEHHQVNLIRWGALGFTLFSHGFWLVWPPFMVFILEKRTWAKKVCLALSMIGFLFAASIYVPFLVYPDWLSVSVQQGSLAYHTQLVYDRIFPRDMSRLIYLLIVLGPLWLSSLKQLRLFGGWVGLSVIVTYCFFNYAFVSVWCFWAALLSLYIVNIIRSLEPLTHQSDRS